MKNWREQYPYDRDSPDWLTQAGRTGRLVAHVGVPTPEEIPDTREPRIVTRPGVGPVTAVIETEADPPVTRGRVIEEQGRR